MKIKPVQKSVLSWEQNDAYIEAKKGSFVRGRKWLGTHCSRT